MKSNHTDSQGLRRRRLLVELIQKKLSKAADIGQLVFSVSELAKHPLLADFDALERAFSKIKEDLKPDFDFKFVKRKAISSAADIDMRNPTSVVESVKVSVDDEGKLKDYPPQDARHENFYFDSEKSRLYLRGIEIEIQKNSDQYHTLSIIFEHPKDVGDEWFFSKIAEKFDMNNSNEKRFYNAIYQVKQKLKAEGFKDVLKTTKYSVKIYPKYLS